MKIKVILETRNDGRVSVFVPSLPSCKSDGENVEEALVNIKNSIELYLKSIEDNFTRSEGMREEVLDL